MSKSNENDALLYQNMRAMISLIDKLRDFNLDDYISLPRITVLGEQSAGKSSLLESICGMNFLPRGSGIVTRRPLELRMVRQSVDVPYFVFPKDFPDKKFTNPEEVRETIELLTKKTAGEQKLISDDPIICAVYSPSVPDLTLVDLPGITRIPIGNQPANIEEITKGLVRKYCEDPNSLILCVIPGNIDLSTSDALNFTKQLDPRGLRTLGVLTKIDIMDEGTDAMNVLLNKEVPLHYGYVGVKGRSQKEVNEKITVTEAIQRELDYFGKHPVYSTLPTELLGTRSLIDRTSHILYDMIKTSLPRIKSEIIERKRKAKEQLEVLGDEFPDNDEKKLELVFRLVRSFKDSYDQEITGRYFHEKVTKKKDKDIVRRRHEETITFQLNRLFSELYEEYTEKGFRVTRDYTDQYIRNAIDVYQGESIPGFHSFDSFLFLINPKLETLKSPIYQLLDEAKNILESKGVEILDFIFKKFSKLQGEVKETFQKVLNQFRNSTRKILENMIRCEENYLFTNDSLMLENPFIDPGKKGNSNDLLAEELRVRIDKYFFIVVRNLKDSVPKMIGHFLLRKFSESLEVEILNSLNRRGYCLDSFNENKVSASQRQKLRHELNSLTNAENLLVNEFGMGFNLKTDIDLGKKPAYSPDRPASEIEFDEDFLQDIDALNDEFLKFNSFLLQNNGGLGGISSTTKYNVPPGRLLNNPNATMNQTNVSTINANDTSTNLNTTALNQTSNLNTTIKQTPSIHPSNQPHPNAQNTSHSTTQQGFKLQQALVHENQGPTKQQNVTINHNPQRPQTQGNPSTNPNAQNTNMQSGQNTVRLQNNQAPQNPNAQANQANQQKANNNKDPFDLNLVGGFSGTGFGNPGANQQSSNNPNKGAPQGPNIFGQTNDANRNKSPINPPKPNNFTIPNPDEGKKQPPKKNNLFGDFY